MLRVAVGITMFVLSIVLIYLTPHDKTDVMAEGRLSGSASVAIVPGD